jgi:hypothetical protein
MAKRGGQRGTKHVVRKGKPKRAKPAPSTRKTSRKSPPPRRGPPRKTPPPRRKKSVPRPPPWVGKPVLGPFDRPLAQQAEFASAYCRKWMAVHDWAMEAVPGDVTLRNGDPRRRSVEGLLVRDMDDSEEAAERGIPLEQFHIDDGPNKEVGGRRRIVIRLLTWLWDVRQQDAYKPQWGTFGTGMTALEATRAFNRYVRDYANAVTKGIESRRLIVTGISIVWWTSDPKELNYV